MIIRDIVHELQSPLHQDITHIKYPDMLNLYGKSDMALAICSTIPLKICRIPKVSVLLFKANYMDI